MKKCVVPLLFMLLMTLPALSQCISGDCFQGSGVRIYQSGARYIGSFERGVREGLGTCYYSNGSQYYGYWKADFPDGPGIKTFADGSKWKGDWRRGKMQKEDPQLVLQSDGKTKNLAQGCINGDCNTGNGVFIYPDGAVYSGGFRNGKREGHGICYYPGNISYQGRWSNDLPDGSGVKTFADGHRESGFYRKGKIIRVASDKEVAQTKQNQNNPCRKGNCENGHGTYAYPDGSTYTGPFYQGFPHGQGTVFYSNGERYEGMFQEGELHGLGTLFYPDGRKISGYWDKGRFMRTADIPAGPSLVSSTNNDVKVWAVIVGVAAYSHMQALKYTDDDAYRIYAFLKSPEGGAVADEQIRLLVDEAATQQNILTAMKTVFGQAGPNDLVLLYFSGHGVPGAFLPIDYDGLHNKVFHQDISSALASSPAKYKLCIADACHSGGMFGVRDVSTTLSSYYDKLAQAQAGAALIMSSKSDETSLEASGLRQGVFSHFLIRGLKGEADRDKDKAVSIQELFDFVYNNVREYTQNRQSPVIRGRFDRDMTVAVSRE